MDDRPQAAGLVIRSAPREPTIATEPRVGQFILDRGKLHNTPLRQLRKLMSNFLVILAKEVQGGTGTLFVAHSPLFREIAAGDQIPLYVIHISSGRNGAVFVRAEEQRDEPSALEALEGLLQHGARPDDNAALSAAEHGERGRVRAPEASDVDRAGDDIVLGVGG